MTRISSRDTNALFQHMSRGLPFQTYGSLSGHVRTATTATGRMEGDTLARFRADSGRMTYVVYSYGTPIAWRGEHGWVMPADRYSVTTSKHQGKIAYVISRMVPGWEPDWVTQAPPKLINMSTPASFGVEWVNGSNGTRFQLVNVRGTASLRFGMLVQGRLGWSDTEVIDPSRFGMTEAPRTFAQFKRIALAYVTG